MDRCKICGMDFSNPSMGGPGICPACDCGIQSDSINHPKNQHQRDLAIAGGQTCGCGCKQLSEADIRRIVREEIIAALAATMRAEGRHTDATKFEAAALGLTNPSLNPPSRHPFQLTPEQLHRVVENFNRGRRSEP